jgi:peptidoglycan/xylan/chitin deacetylase (PgdA/CDA1 family)
MIDRGLEALDRVAGIRPEGYRAPMWEMNYHTPKLLAERGFLYDSSLMDADFPYELAAGDAGGNSLVELPVWWGLDDWEQYAFLPDLMGSGVIESPAKVLEMWTLELDAMHRLGALFDLCCHPFLSGRPARAEAVERLLTHMLELPGMWVTSLGEIARHVRSLSLEPRTLAPPVIPDAHWIGESPSREARNG